MHATLFLSDFADEAVILPQVVAIAAALMAGRNWRALGAWAAAAVGVLGGMLLLKLGFYHYDWNALVPAQTGIDLANPSGHVAAASVTYGAVATLLLARRGATIAVAIGAALLTSVVIGATRVRLGEHTVPDVVAGAVIGVAGAVVFALLARRHLPARTGFAVLPGLGLAALLFHGQHLPAESLIRAVAAW